MTALLRATALALPGRLQSTDFQLEGGELTCLVGPNGSGKTSLLHALARVGRPGGIVEIAGEDVGRLAPERRARMLAYLPASRDVAWPLLARDVIALGGANGEDACSGALFEALGVTTLAPRRMDRLSTGERSRVLLARALLGQPCILLLDEPTANLDPLWQIRIMEQLRAEVRQHGRSALIAVHDLDIAEAYADRLIVMEGGRIAADGVPADILAGPVIPAIFGVRRAAGRWVPA